MSFQLAELQEEKISTQEEKISTQEEKITTQEAENLELKRQIIEKDITIKCKDKVNLSPSVGMNPSMLILGHTPVWH